MSKMVIGSKKFKIECVNISKNMSNNVVKWLKKVNGIYIIIML